MSKVNITHSIGRYTGWQNANNNELQGFSERDRLRFWAKVERGLDAACWLWTASKFAGRGYGQFAFVTPGGASRRKLSLYAHRVAWTLTHGPIPVGVSVCHTCDNPSCVNPAHLFLGTHTDNMRDASAKGRLSIPRIRNRRAQQDAIRRYLEGGVTLEQVGAEFSVHAITVHRWVKEARRQHPRAVAS